MELARRECATVDWESLRACGGGAEGVGDALLELTHAKSADEAEEAYWRLENRIVVQGSVYQSAAPAVTVLVAALHDELSDPALIKVLDLLYQILTGAPDPVEVADGNGSLIEECIARARLGLWGLLRRFALEQRPALRDAFEDVLQAIDPNHYELFKSTQGQ